MATISEVLRNHRIATGATVRKLASEIGVSASTLSRIENGSGNDLNTALLLMTWLFGGERKGPAKDTEPYGIHQIDMFKDELDT